MRRRSVLLATLTLFAVLVSAPAAAGDWPSWRGPDNTGKSRAGTPPLRWSETENVRFKVPIPGRGHATPIVWKDRIYLLTAVAVDTEAAAKAEEMRASGGRPAGPPPAGARPGGHGGRQRPRGQAPVAQRFVVLALDLATGTTVWEKTANEAMPVEGTHSDATWASASPVTDGEYLFAQFGSQGLYAYDLDGNLKWQKDLGDMQTRNGFGEGSSPVVHGETVVVNWDHEGESFIVAVDRKTGAERWRKSRDEPTSWATPLVVEAAGKPQVVVAATGASRAYDLANGDVIWQLSGLTMNVVPTPSYSDGVVYMTSGFRGNAMQAVRIAKAQGELSGSEAVAWTHDRHTPYVPSPLVYDDKVYFLKSNTAILTCLDAKTGEVIYTEKRLEGLDTVYASLVGAQGRVYVVGRGGTTLVLKHGAELEVLATNVLDEGFDASPAIAGGELLLRGRSHLYSLVEGGGKADGP